VVRVDLLVEERSYGVVCEYFEVEQPLDHVLVLCGVCDDVCTVVYGIMSA
jgi:hypothetical protein